MVVPLLDAVTGKGIKRVTVAASFLALLGTGFLELGDAHASWNDLWCVAQAVGFGVAFTRIEVSRVSTAPRGTSRRNLEERNVFMSCLNHDVTIVPFVECGLPRARRGVIHVPNWIGCRQRAYLNLRFAPFVLSERCVVCRFSTTWKSFPARACSYRSDSSFPSPDLLESGVLTLPVVTSQISGGVLLQVLKYFIFSPTKEERLKAGT